MREELETELALVSDLLVAMAAAVRSAMRTATTALLTADRSAADAVVTGDAEVNDLRSRVEDRVYATTARQAPVASDLRALFTALHMAADLERMGDLAKHVAQIAQRSHPEPAVPTELSELFSQMGQVADQVAGKITQVLSEADSRGAAQLDHDDDAMDRLHRDLLGLLLDPSRSYSTQTAIDAALLGRFYERYADHAVNAGRQVVFLVTGKPVSG
jgi:phosphate transport system protein